jgi:glyoxylase-like metal-dependent hydrolase (beta-lactamase superfamily II)/8-oxo-dGTP pyrophosphatase MutT (NUDIX family)
MVRLHTQVYPARAVVPVRPAATVLLLRDTPHGIEVLMTRRSMTASFAPGAYVFPGGGIDTLDTELAKTPPHKSQTATAFIARRSSQSDTGCTQALAAIRESFEELGILLARKEGGAWCSQADIDALDRSAAFYPAMQQRSYTLAADAVYSLAHWITDRDMGRRFDVPFLVARVPEGQTPVADEAEQFVPEWIGAADALARHAAGQFLIIFPTIRTLEHLQAFKSVDEVLQACASEQPLWTSCPRAGLLGGKEVRYMEHEAAFGELAMVCPDGQIVHPLDWQHTRPVQLLTHVMRLTAPNPGMMTGPGTNTYIIGTPDTGYVVVDPGPDDQGHIRRILDATDGDINAIVCTHSHADHSPAAMPLQALAVEKTNTVPGDLMGVYAKHICPILGLPSAPSARSSAAFDPDITLQDNELLTPYFRGQEANDAFKITLQVIHTPGHAANHLCLVLQEDGLLISGDHILNGSTTVIDPPDGDMTAYLDSLNTLAAACEQHSIDFILPAHGYVLTRCDGTDHTGGAKRAIEELKAHRLKREAKVIAAMRAQPGGSVKDWIPSVYGDVDTKLWPIAERSLTAHVQRIEALGLLG